MEYNIITCRDRCSICGKWYDREYYETLRHPINKTDEYLVEADPTNTCSQTCYEKTDKY